MSVFKGVKRTIRRVAGRLRRDRPALITYLFHSLFPDASAIDQHHLDPQQAITVDHFAQFVRHYTQAGYTFVSPDDVQAGLDATGRYVMATFDDGYFNNRLALQVLEQFNVPAVFFISTGHVNTGRSFWWDAIHRQRDTDVAKALLARRSELKTMTADAIEAAACKSLGDDCLTPVGELDRPFTPDELREFASHDLVHIGNHTVDHAVLTSYDAAGQLEQITGCQNDLEAITGTRPTIISYPNGNHDPVTLEASQQAGLTLGITVEKRKNYLPLGEGVNARLTLGRFTLWGDDDIDAQCEVHRSDMTFGALRGRRDSEMMS